MSGEKRSQDQDDTLLEETTIIVDIEGTTSSISFVKETLFPYIRENLKQYIEKNWEEAEFKEDLEKLKEQAKKDESDKVGGVISITGTTPEEERDSVVKNVLWQMDGDRKTGALKQLQGHMWRDAYKSGAVKGHVYDDVPKAFDSWTKSGRKIYVYSSGSVDAQKLLFGHSEHGDLMKYFSGYFDTEVGSKQETSSYKNILAKIEAEPSSVLFLTDIVKEAQAAKEAGISVNIVVREGNAPLTDEEKVTFSTIKSFTDLSFQTSAKRQKVEKSDEKEATTKAEPEVAASEPMDTSEDAEVPAQKVPEKVEEKVDDAKKPVESEKNESESNSVENTGVTSMEVESKPETDKKTAEVTEKLVTVAEETKKTEEESKAKDSKETAKETSASESDDKKSEVTKADSEATKGEESKVTKEESQPTKEENKVTKVEEKKEEETKVTKEESSSVTKEDNQEITKEESSSSSSSEEAKKSSEEATKMTDDTSNKASEQAPVKDSQVTKKTEVKVAESEPMDEDKNELPSKSELIATITEEKTEIATKLSAEAESHTKTETEGKPAAVSESAEKPKEATSVEVSSANEESSKTTPVENKTSEQPPVEVEKKVAKVEQPEVTEDATEKSGAPSKLEDKPSAPEVQQNGDSAAPAKATEAKTELNGDAKEKIGEKDEATADNKAAPASAATAASAAAPTAAKDTNDKSESAAAESANKDDNETDIKSKSDDTAAASAPETGDSKLNGNSQNGEKATKLTDEKPHRNGLNGDSSSEKSNGNTKEENPSAQNGAAESTTEATSTPTESIKVKKVVDSTIADGAGEPEVVPPVAVAATS